MTTKGKLNPKDILDAQFEEKAKLKAIEEKIYQTMEVSSLHTQITYQAERVEELKAKVLKVETEQRDAKENTLVASKKLEELLDAKIIEYEKLEALFEYSKQEYEEKIQTIITQKDEEIANLNREIYNAKHEAHRKIAEQKDEIEKLKDFKERREEYYSDLEQLKKKFDDLIHTHNDELKRIDNKNSKAIQMQQDKHEKEINEIMHNAKKEAEAHIGKLEKQVMEDNKKLRLDLLEYKKELDVLKKEKEKAVEENKQIRQNVSLQEDGAIEYQAILYRQETKIKKLKEKIQVLKTYIAQEVNKHTKEVESLKYSSSVRNNELETQLQTMRDELRVRVKETRNLKTLSQIILDQRSEIEEFLIETLDHVKDEVRKQRTLDNKRTRLPTISNSASKLDLKPKKNWEKLEFTSLDWEDKEKILRILFSKMNTGLIPTNWRTMTMEKSSADFGNQSGHVALDSYKASFPEGIKSL